MTLNTSNTLAINIVSHLVKKEKIIEYEAWQNKLIQTSSCFRGYEASVVLKPGLLTKSPNEYVIIFRFSDKQTLEQWLDSQPRLEALKGIDEFSIRPPIVKRFPGLENWFNVDEEIPSRLVLTIISFIAIWPLVHFIPPNLNFVLTENMIISEALVLAVITILMSYVSLPLMTYCYTALIKRIKKR